MNLSMTVLPIKSAARENGANESHTNWYKRYEALPIGQRYSATTAPVQQLLHTFKDPMGHPGGRVRVLLTVLTIPSTMLRAVQHLPVQNAQHAMATSGSQEEK